MLEDRKKKLICIIIAVLILVSFMLSLVSILKYGDYFLLGSMEEMDNDDVKYIRSAQTLLDKGTLVYKYTDQPTAFIMPGLPFTLAFFMKLFGTVGGITAFRIFQALLNALCILLIYLIARKFFNRKISLLACLLNFIYLPQISNTGLILTEEVFKFLLLLLIYITINALESKKVKLYILGGVCLGLACLFRPTIALYPAVVLVMWLIRKYKFKEMLKFAGVTIAAFIIIMAPWWIRNYSTFNQFIPLTKSSGNPFLQGTYINYDQSKNPPVYKETKTEFEKDEYEMQLGKDRLIKNFSQHPFEYAYWYTLGKTIDAWRVPYLYRPIFGISYNSMYKMHLVYLGLCILGIVMAIIRRKQLKGISILLFMILYFNCVYLPFLSSSRYIYPIIPVFFIFGAYFIYSMGNMVRKLVDWRTQKLELPG